MKKEKKVSIKDMYKNPLYDPIEILETRISSLRAQQLEAFEKMQHYNVLQLRYPCSFGKGYLMITDLLNQHVQGLDKISVIVSHRLALNDQHAREIFDVFKTLIGKVAFLFVGSKGGLKEEEEIKFNGLINLFNIFNEKQIKDNLSFKKLVKRTIEKKEAQDFIKDHIAHGRKVIVVSTYNSIDKLEGIDIDTIYCDEAHELASNSFNSKKKDSFINKYKKLTCKRKFFFTATPKLSSDLDKNGNDILDSHLMSNKALFGEVIGMSYKEAVMHGYSVKAKISKVYPENFDLAHGIDYSSPYNEAKLIEKALGSHKKFLRKYSAFPKDIKPMMLVRTSDVKNKLWPTYKALCALGIKGVKIFACASTDVNGNTVKTEVCYSEKDGEHEYTGANSRENFIADINKCNSPTIILHHDTLSEGINIYKITAFMPLTDNAMTAIKFIQNFGRAVRLDPFDRKRYYEGKIKIGDKNWKKPYAEIIMPIFSLGSQEAFNVHAKFMSRLENENIIGMGNSITIGDDSPTGNDPDGDLDENNEQTTGAGCKIEVEKVVYEPVDLMDLIDKENQKRLELYEKNKKYVDDDLYSDNIANYLKSL